MTVASVGAPAADPRRLWARFDLTLTPDVHVDGEGPGITLSDGGERLAFGSLPMSCTRVLHALAAGTCLQGDLRRAVASVTDRLALAVILDRLESAGWLSYSVGGAKPWLLAVPRTRGLAPARPVATGGLEDGVGAQSGTARERVDDPSEGYRLSRFCHVRGGPSGLSAVSPVSGYEVRLLDARALELLDHLARGMPGPAGSGPEGTAAELLDGLALLVATGVAVPGGADDEPPYWEPHDLLFHTESREGFVQKPFGGTYRIAGPQPEPATETGRAGIVALEAPPAVRQPRGHFFEVLDRRRSIRRHGVEPCSIDQVAEFLYRSARTTGQERTEYGLVETRPYPGGGAIHELVLYLVIHRVRGLGPGVYRYGSASHTLVRLPVTAEATRPLLRDSAAASMRTEPPDVLIVITAQVGRLAWKYEAIAYALVLKHVGALMQTMYLVATAMGLAPCAIGGGDARRFAAICGLDPFQEPSVGEFMLGSLPMDAPRAAGDAAASPGTSA